MGNNENCQMYVRKHSTSVLFEGGGHDGFYNNNRVYGIRKYWERKETMVRNSEIIDAHGLVVSYVLVHGLEGSTLPFDVAILLRRMPDDSQDYVVKTSVLPRGVTLSTTPTTVSLHDV